MIRRALPLIALLFTLVGCNMTGPAAEPPTLAVLPTLTETPIPSETPLPSATPLPTWTSTPTTSPTPSPTLTRTPLPTRTPSLTPTRTLTFTPSATPTASNTPTNTPTPTPAVPAINELSVSPEEAEIGERVTLSWEADADTLTVEVQDQFGTTLNTYDLPPGGSQPFIVPAGARRVLVFRMTAQRSGISETRSVAVSLGCAALWFFDAETLIPRDTCPAGTPTTETGRVQTFERGVMVWSPGRGRVYVLYSGTESGVFNNFTLTTPDNPLPDPPPGFFRPQLEFEGVWEETLSRTGNRWQSEIGFGTQPAQAVTITWQTVDGNPNFYLDAGNIFLYEMLPSLSDNNFGAWNRLREP